MSNSNVGVKFTKKDWLSLIGAYSLATFGLMENSRGFFDEKKLLF